MFPFPNAKDIPNARVDDLLKFLVKLSRQVTDEKRAVVDQEKQKLNKKFTQFKRGAFPKKV